jgi:hypothetical protein
VGQRAPAGRARAPPTPESPRSGLTEAMKSTSPTGIRAVGCQLGGSRRGPARQDQGRAKTWRDRRYAEGAVPAKRTEPRDSI